MFDKFCDYMYYLLTSPFKRVKKSINQWYILFRVLGRRFDDALESLYNAEDQTMLATCEPEMLPVHAEDRKMARYPGEEDENFRARIANYPEVLRLGGTDQGVLLAVRTLGYANPEIVKANKYKECVCQDTEDHMLQAIGKGDRWAEFYIVIKMKVDDSHPISISVLKQEVRKAKYVGAKDNYSFQYDLCADVNQCKFHTEWYTKFCLYRLDRGWKLDNGVTLDAYIEDKEELKMADNMKTTRFREKEAASRLTGKIAPFKYIALGVGAREDEQIIAHSPEDKTLFLEVIRKNAQIKVNGTIVTAFISLSKMEALDEEINEIALIDAEGDVAFFSTFPSKTKSEAEDTYTITIQ